MREAQEDVLPVFKVNHQQGDSHQGQIFRGNVQSELIHITIKSSNTDNEL